MAELSLYQLNERLVPATTLKDGFMSKEDKTKLDNALHVTFRDSAPAETNTIWIDTSDDISTPVESSFMTEIRTQLSSFGTVVDKLSYLVDHEVDSGYFKDIIPGTTTEAHGSVKHIIVKRGYKADLDTLQIGEMGFCIDTEELYIGNPSKGGLRLIAKVGGTSSGGSGSTLTGQYLELVSTDGSKYRLTVNDDGQPVIINSVADTADAPAPTDNGRFAGLFINKVYGGGSIDTNDTPVSHSFIELYNSTDNTMNLKGLALQYGQNGTSWEILPLRGTIKPYTSFVIRGARHSDPYRQTTRFKVIDFDMSWPDLNISPNGFKVYLNIPVDITKATTYTNPANTDGNWTKETGYINMFCAGGDDPSRVIDAFESTTSGSGNSYGQIVNKYRIIKRAYSQATTSVFSNTGNSYNDLEYLDAREADIQTYKPRPQRFGQWNYFYNQLALDPNVPNNVNVCFGKKGDTDRTFTWQSLVTELGYLKYKVKGDNNWITVPSTKKFCAFLDVDVTIHSVIIRGLTPNTYVYKVGSEGKWSDEYELVVADATPTSRTMKILQVSDQQGWDRWEYTAWQKANAFIESNETYDFIINTGDISQNGNRPYEWRYYYYYAKQNVGSHVHMTCVGNNDLVDKKDPIAFTYYTTCENYYNLTANVTAGSSTITCTAQADKIVTVGDVVTGTGIATGSIVVSASGNTITLSQNATATGTNILLTCTPIKTYPSLYSFNYGFCHFICLNSNIIAGYSACDEQIDFIRKDMANPTNQKRWTIVYMHEEPYAIVSSTILRPFINVFDEVGIDLVICGHHHCYSRSKRMGSIPTLLHFNGDFKDASPNKVWTANGGAATNTTTKKFGTASLYLDGVDDSISTKSNYDFLIPAGQSFTLDFWVNCGTQSKTSPTILSNGSTTQTDDCKYISLDSSGKLVFKYGSQSPISDTNALVGTTNICDSTWHHIAIVRNVALLQLYVDGSLQKQATYSGSIDFSLDGTYIGRNGWDATNSFFNGYIDEFHLVKKVANWLGNFTVPAAAYTLVDTVVPDGMPGTYYIMSQATGFKNSGKQTPTAGAVWPALIDRQGDPCYIMYEIGYNSIVSKPYRLTQILPLIDNVNNPVVPIPFDQYTITK